MPRSKVALDNGFKVTSPLKIDPMDKSGPDSDQNQSIWYHSPWSGQPRLPCILELQVKILEVLGTLQKSWISLIFIFIQLSQDMKRLTPFCSSLQWMMINMENWFQKARVFFKSHSHQTKELLHGYRIVILKTCCPFLPDQKKNVQFPSFWSWLWKHQNDVGNWNTPTSFSCEKKCWAIIGFGITHDFLWDSFFFSDLHPQVWHESQTVQEVTKWFKSPLTPFDIVFLPSYVLIRCLSSLTYPLPVLKTIWILLLRPSGGPIWNHFRVGITPDVKDPHTSTYINFKTVWIHPLE